MSIFKRFNKFKANVLHDTIYFIAQQLNRLTHMLYFLKQKLLTSILDSHCYSNL